MQYNYKPVLLSHETRSHHHAIFTMFLDLTRENIFFCAINYYAFIIVCHGYHEWYGIVKVITDCVAYWQYKYLSTNM